MTHAPPPMPDAAAKCPWCGAAVGAQDLSCPSCGAPVALKPKASASGWTELPSIRDMARLRIGQTTCQIEGVYVPVADFNLAAGDSVYFSHHTLLWKDTSVEVRKLSGGGWLGRMMAGMPIVMVAAHGPGHVAFSRDEPGEVIALPLHPHQQIDVREHLLLTAAGGVAFKFFATNLWVSMRNGKDTDTSYPVGRWMNKLQAGDQPGMILLHAAGNAFVRQLAEGQFLLIKPDALVYKDPSVRMSLEFDHLYQISSYAHRVLWLRLHGPGRVAIQSAYVPFEDRGGPITSMANTPR